MKQEYKYFKTFIESSQDLYCIIDSDLNLTYANGAFKLFYKEAFGVKVEIGSAIFLKGIEQEASSKWQNYCSKVLSGEVLKFQESFIFQSNLRAEFYDISLNPIQENDGFIKEIAFQAKNITKVINSNTEAEKIMDASLDVICSINEHGIFTKVSAACKELWGYEKHELVGKPFIDFVLEEDIEETNLAAEQTYYGKRLTTFKNRYKRKDGQIAYNLWSARNDPETNNLYCIARDAREILEKEDLLLESENRFKALVQEGSDLIGILDEAGTYTYVSPTSIGILGIAPEEFIGKSPFDFIHPEDAGKVLNSLGEIAVKDRVEVEPFRFQNKDGDWRWIETVLTNMLNNPNIQGIVANSRDITEKKIETQHLKLLETVVTNAKDVILITEAEPQDSPGPKIVYVNDAFTKLTGYTREEVIGKSPRILQGPKSDYEALEQLGKALRNRETHEITTINYKKNREEYWINFTVIPVANAQGLYTHWFAIEREVTDKKNEETVKELTAKISEIFNVQSDLHSALNDLCKESAILGKFSFCEVWLTDVQENVLELKAYYENDENAKVFYDHSPHDISLKKGHGLPGEVWRKNQSVVWESAKNEIELLARSKAAAIAGITTVVGFPLIYHDKFIGVLQFGTQSSSKDLSWIVDVFNDLGRFIGSEIAKKETEIRFLKIFEFAPDVIAIGGFDGYFKMVNPYASKLLGYTEQELLSKPFSSFLHPDDIDTAFEGLKALQLGEDVHNLRNRYITKNGDIKTLSWNCSASNEDGLIFCIGKDITDEVKIARLLNDANQISRIGGWEVDMINQTLYWSDIVYEIHETNKSFDLNLNSAIQFYREDYQELVKAKIDECIETGFPVDFEAVIVTAKGKEVWVRSIGRAEIVNGKCIRVYGSVQDIDKIKSTELRLNSIANNVPGVIYQYQLFPDGTDRLLHLSNGAKKLWEVEPEAAMRDIGIIWDQINKAGDIEQVKASILDSMTSLSDWYAQFRATLPSGKVKWLEGLGTPRKQADGSTIWDSIILDITELKETEALLAAASNLARVGSWEMVLQDNAEFKMFWSPITKEIVEFDQDAEPTVDDGINLFLEPEQTKIKVAVNHLIETGEAFDLELNVLTAKGNEVWVRCIGNAEMKEGVVSRIFGSFQDINSRKIAELNQIKFLEEKNSILESIGDGFLAVDNEWKVTYWNGMAEELLGKKREDILGRTLWEEYPEATKNSFFMNFHLAMEKQEIVNFEDYNKSSKQWFEASAYPSRDGLSVFFKDITNKKEFDLKIKQANERFEKVAEATADAIWDWDIEHNKFYKGDGFLELYGYQSKKAMNQLKFDESKFHSQDLPEIKASITEALQNPSQTQWEMQYQIVQKSGDIKTVIDKAKIIRDAHGKALRMIGAIKDVTYLIEHEKQLLALNQVLQTKLKELGSAYEELEQFAYIASHDLQEPLRMVAGFMNQLKRRYGENLDEKAHEYIEFAVDGAKRMKQIILDLLEYSRAGKYQEETVEINVKQILEDYKILRRSIIAEKQVEFKTNDLPLVKTYSTPLIQIFHNLLDNAIKYSREGIMPLVNISCRSDRAFWEFCIEDNGIGIDTKYFDKIFIIFQRLHDRDQFEGTGIGLSIVKKQVESLGGKIWIESELNKGSKFYFTIPK